MGLDVYIEGLLFYKATPLSKKQVAKLLHVSEPELAHGLSALRERLASGAVRLIETETEIELATAPELSEFVEGLQKAELKTDIGKAGAETLAIIMYRSPVSRLEIDTIRGVNSSYILRNLQIRGLIERQASGNKYTFSPSTDLLAHLGITRKEELPDYARVMDQIEAFAVDAAGTSE